MKILVVGGSRAYFKPFAKMGTYTENVNCLIDEKDNVRFAVFTGGEDVHPFLYCENKNVRTYENIKRDYYEMLVFNMCLRQNIPMVGICRGSQFLCVMSGGKLVQHVENHSESHQIELYDKRKINVTSTHHQMQLPPKDANILGWCEKRSKVYLDGDDNNIPMDKDIEIVYYPNTNCIGMQYHPEYMQEDSEGFKLPEQLVNEFIK